MAFGYAWISKEGLRELIEWQPLSIYLRTLKLRLLSEAESSGIPFRQFVRDVLIDHLEDTKHLEDTEDRRVAESRLEYPQVPITVGELGRNHGLDN